MISIIFLAGITLAAVLAWTWWRSQQTYRPLKALPSPPGHRLFGNIQEAAAAVRSKKYFQLLYNWAKQYGPIYTFWTGSPTLVLSKPLSIEACIINGMKRGDLIRSPRINRAWNDITGPIMLGQTGEEWQWRRKAWNTEFSPNAMAASIEVVQQACSQASSRIEAEGLASPLEVDPLFVELTTRVIACLLLGIPVDPAGMSPEGPALDVEKLYNSMSVVSYRFLRMAIGEWAWKKYLPFPSSLDYWAARRYLDTFLSPRISKALGIRDGLTMEEGSLSPQFKHSMLVKIVATEPRYTSANLIAEMVELLIAGTDTTAHTLSFAVGELALHPEIFRKARTLVDQAWPEQGPLSMESLKQLGYLRAIVKETLRLYGVASGSTSLLAVRETVVEGIAIPPGTKVSWSMLAAGRDGETYAQPEVFLPERWLDDHGAPLALPMLAFGSGSHRCIGEHLAMLEAILMLAQLLRNFDWELVKGRSSLENLEQNLLIYPADGMPVRFSRRTIPVVHP